ncbi:LOW QUALITY PROTEIN: probable phenylalanine--tRNA ligase, mitochondrial [Pollicipes pollicipes]|uniref:LOW QUALITY PROTEIN: probable phenylalanine--tRNA ligase, mitochondrial n=1 Tax=Pollicipes pollicipes TaxID=41117 RepID=UPI001885179E|nr:LOW QUALITY PROTEIN: probable phenylalanine--tRNA ligase, mitochondrial [Pollicipes pollicipes]
MMLCRWLQLELLRPCGRAVRFVRCRRIPQSPQSRSCSSGPPLLIDGAAYQPDSWTNVTPRVLQLVGRRLHEQPHHPLCLLKQRVTRYMHGAFRNARGNPLFSLHERLGPVVSVAQNFDSLLVPADHPSRRRSDNYYVCADRVLRAHTSAHQAELLAAGLDAFLVAGDVYRRDEIDRTHYPVFHQMEGVRVQNREQLFGPLAAPELRLFEPSPVPRRPERQQVHTLEAVKLMEHDLKTCLEGLARRLFGADIEFRWVDCYFPFTHPSWELEVQLDGDWMEVLGCGIMEHQILENSGVGDRIGWAFGLGLERLAMKLYDIPDIRLFWSRDTGFLNQFRVEDCEQKIRYKLVSQHPQCSNDLSFWLPAGDAYSSADFYDLVRTLGGDLVEQVSLVDEFRHPKTGRASHCYRITYRHMERTLTQAEVNGLHERIAQAAAQQLAVSVR